MEIESKIGSNDISTMKYIKSLFADETMILKVGTIFVLSLSLSLSLIPPLHY
jgi:hypothetical protein